MLTATKTPAIYRTTISHSRQAPVRHAFEYRSYSWYVDVDELPRLPWWLRPFARFRASDHFDNQQQGSLRDRLGAFFADRGLPAPRAASPRCCKHGCSATSSTRSASFGATTARAGCVT